MALCSPPPFGSALTLRARPATVASGVPAFRSVSFAILWSGVNSVSFGARAGQKSLVFECVSKRRGPIEVSFGTVNRVFQYVPKLQNSCGRRSYCPSGNSSAAGLRRPNANAFAATISVAPASIGVVNWSLTSSQFNASVTGSCR
jgi:hypothetical protein